MLKLRMTLIFRNSFDKLPKSCQTFIVYSNLYTSKSTQCSIKKNYLVRSHAYTCCLCKELHIMHYHVLTQTHALYMHRVSIH